MLPVRYLTLHFVFWTAFFIFFILSNEWRIYFSFRRLSTTYSQTWSKLGAVQVFSLQSGYNMTWKNLISFQRPQNEERTMLSDHMTFCCHTKWLCGNVNITEIYNRCKIWKIFIHEWTSLLISVCTCTFYMYIKKLSFDIFHFYVLTFSRKVLWSVVHCAFFFILFRNSRAEM